MIDGLWGESAPSTAAKIVQNEAVRLRKTLGDRLVTRAPGYLLRVESGELDSELFERLVARARDLPPGDAADALQEALSLWRGPPLADLAYEDFAQSETSRLAELRLTAVEDRIDADLALGRHAHLVGELEALVRAQPLRERLAGQLILALYRSARQAEALEVYRRTRGQLVDELGLEPGPELRRLEAAILRHDPELKPRARAGATAAAAPARKVGVTARPRHTRWGAAGLLAVAALAVAIAAIAGGGSAAPVVPADSVAVIDPGTNQIVGSVPVGTRPGSISFGGGALWVANLGDDSVSRIDLATRHVARTIAVGDLPAGLAASSGGVWVASPNGALRRIDPTYDDVHQVRRGSPGYVAAVELPSPVALGQGAVWVASKTTVARIDPSTGRQIASTGVGLAPAGIAVGDGSVWIADAAEDTVTRIDPSTDTATRIAVGHGPRAVAVGFGATWVADSLDDAVVRVDPDTNAVLTTIPVGGYPAAIAVGDGAVWVANYRTGTVSRINPRTNQVTATLAVGDSPSAITVAAGRVWVAIAANVLTAAGGAATAAGIARVDIQTDADLLALDPALADASDAWQIEYATCAKLLNYPDQPAPAGSHLAPDAARSLPTVSADGRTYTFDVRDNVRFSPPSGAPVTANTFRATIERTLSPRMHSPAGVIMGAILGASSYMAGKGAHIAGIAAAGQRLTIRLSEADPVLPVKLATPYFCAVPPDTPTDPAGVPGIPSAGPYYVPSFAPGQQVVLRRNPNYHGSRPHRLAEIDYAIGFKPETSIERIEAGTADYLAITLTAGIPYADHLQLLARYGRGDSATRGGKPEYFVHPALGQLVIWLNTKRPLFAHINLRRAFSYAIDRSALIREDELSGGPVFLPSDQYLSPGMPGYRNVQVYPLDHPDVTTARRLAGPGPHGTAVLYAGIYDQGNDQLIASARHAIGIQTVVRRFSINELLARERNPTEPYDLVAGGYGIDYPDPYDILNSSLDGTLPSSHGFSNFNDPAYSRKLEAAARLTGTDRFRAYAQLDHDLTRNAAPMAAWATFTSQDFFSARMGCQTYNPIHGIDLAALCLRSR